MNLPRWLVIVGILVIVLGILACGIGAGRAIDEGRPPATPTPTPTPRSDLDLIPVFPVPAQDIVHSGNCSRTTAGGVTRFTGTGCTLTVTPSGFFPREIRLRIEAGSGVIVVSQEIRGTSQPAATTLPSPTGTVSPIRVAGSTPVRVTANCFSQCQIRVLSE